MPRAHHRTAAMNGPDALDWFDAADALEEEFGCEVRLVCKALNPAEGLITVRAIRVINDVSVLLSSESVPYPNVKLQGFWPSAFLMLHRVRVAVANQAYASERHRD